MERNLDVTKPSYSEHILSVPWPFVISRLHCILIYLFIYLLFSHNKDYTSITLYKDVARGPQKTTRLVRGGPLVTIILSNRTITTEIERVHIKPFNRPALPLLFHALKFNYCSVKNLSKVGFWVKYKNLFAALKHKIM